MAILLAIVMAINGYINMVELRRVAGEMDRVVAAMPNFGVKGGRFYFDGPMPYKSQHADGTLILVDTTGQTTPDSLARLGRQASVLVTEETIYIIQPGVAPRELSLKQLTRDVTREDVRQFLASRPERILTFVYLFIYLFQLGFKAVDGIILALIAQAYGAAMGRKVPFELGFKLALYAMTLPVIMQWVLTRFHTYTTAGFTIWWSMATIYLIFGLRACFAGPEPEGQTQA